MFMPVCRHLIILFMPVCRHLIIMFMPVCRHLNIRFMPVCRHLNIRFMPVCRHLIIMFMPVCRHLTRAVPRLVWPVISSLVMSMMISVGLVVCPAEIVSAANSHPPVRPCAISSPRCCGAGWLVGGDGTLRSSGSTMYTVTMIIHNWGYPTSCKFQ